MNQDSQPMDLICSESQDEHDPSFMVTLQIRAKHADLLAAVRKFGTVAALAAHLDVQPTTLYRWLSMTRVPPVGAINSPQRWNNPEWVKEFERKLFLVTGKTMDELWPDEIRSQDFLSRQKVIEHTGVVSLKRLSLNHEAVVALPAPTETPDDVAAAGERKNAIDRALASLTWREREIIKCRYGLDGEFPLTYDEAGRKFKVTRERIRQIESKAIRKLQHPTRSEELEKHLEDYDPQSSFEQWLMSASNPFAAEDA